MSDQEVKKEITFSLDEVMPLVEALKEMESYCPRIENEGTEALANFNELLEKRK